MKGAWDRRRLAGLTNERERRQMTIPDDRQRPRALCLPLGHQLQGSPAVRGNQDDPWRSRGYLPHFEGQSIPQALTFRLADSLPKHVLAQIERDIAKLPGTKTGLERRRRSQDWLDQGSGSCWLAEPSVAMVVEGAISFLDERKYHLHAWVVMPNHVHILFSPMAGSTLAAVAHSLKSYTAKEANRLLGRTGPFWQREYFDRAIRDIEHFRTEVEYIEANPIKAGLCPRIRDWRFSSARFRQTS